MRKKAVFSFILLCMLIVGCSNTTTETSTPVPVIQPTISESEVTPYPVAIEENDVNDVIEPGYPVVTSSITPIPVQAIPTASATTGNLVGVVHSTATNLPIINVPVQLAEVIRQNGEAVFVLDGASSPFAIADEIGQFIFTDVIPGEYFVVVGNAEMGTYEIYQDGDGNGVSYFINAGEVAEAGTVRVGEIENYETENR